MKIMSNTIMVVCKEYKLLKNGKEYIKEGGLIQRKNAKVTRAWAEEKNDNWKQCGIWYDIDEEATERYYEEGRLKLEKRNEAIAKKDRLVTIASDMLDNANKIVDKDVSELDKLRADYKERFDKDVPPRYKNDAEWITKKLNE